MEGYQKTLKLLEQLISSKKNLADTLVDKGEEASINDPFDDLVEKAADYVPKTMVFVAEDGSELIGTVIDGEDIEVDATVNDVREGKRFVTAAGVETGEKFIPSYIVSEGYSLIPNGSVFQTMPLADLSRYDFTRLQAIICPYSGTIDSSVAADKVAINNDVYAVNSKVSIAIVVGDESTKRINFGFVNNSGSLYVLRYFTYKEIY